MSSDLRDQEVKGERQSRQARTRQGFKKRGEAINRSERARTHDASPRADAGDGRVREGAGGEGGGASQGAGGGAARAPGARPNLKQLSTSIP